MFRPEHLQSDNLNRFSTHSERSLTGKQSSALVESSDFDALVDSLMPEGISPNKQAVIEQLIMMWVAKSELDVA